MFHLQSVPFACPYHAEVTCPVSVLLSERDPDKLGLAEAMPCHVCPHYLDGARTLFAQRRVRLGPLGRRILTAVRERGTLCFPLSATLRTDLPHRVDLRRLRKAVRALVAVRAVRTFRLPAVVPRAYNPLHLVLRETLWGQVTAVGEVLNDCSVGRHRAGWRTRQAAFAARIDTLRTTLTQTDLFAVYVQQVVTVVTEVTHHLVAATDPVMVALCTGADSPYVGVFVHLEAIAPAACVELQQVYLRAQDARRRSFALSRAAEKHHGKTSSCHPGSDEHRAGGGEGT